MFGAATVFIFIQKTAKLIGPIHQLYLLYHLIYLINFIYPFPRNPHRPCN